MNYRYMMTKNRIVFSIIDDNNRSYGYFYSRRTPLENVLLNIENSSIIKMIEENRHYKERNIFETLCVADYHKQLKVCEIPNKKFPKYKTEYPF